MVNVNPAHLFPLQARDIEHTLHLAIEFLYHNQLEHGEFRTYAAGNEAMDEDCIFDSSPFTTSFVLYSLRFYHDVRIQEITARGLNFLRSEMEGKGIWRYWSSHHASHQILPPDLDDTCCISFVLKQHRLTLANHEIILANKNRDGLFYTWLAPRADMPPKLMNEIQRVTKADSLPLFSLNGTLENVDCAVNANVLLYLGECNEVQAVIAYLKRSVASKELPDTSYYADSLAFYYLLSRAYLNGIASLDETRSTVLRSVLSRKSPDGSFGNELLTALAVCTWLNFSGPRNQLDDSIAYLMRTQSKGGFWKKIPMWLGPAPYYGSEELTTAFCVEALARYIQ